ncbi:MAG: MBOAT family protein [Burkholderiales bacterium]|nr:MBOAT family protein [Burkholderiales bacterium]
MQIYFDFSGYSEMAIGLARMFGVRLPANFNSPFKASNIIDFWARWHMTLTRFLTAYVYTPIVMRRTRSRMAQGKPILSRKSRTFGAFAALVAGPTLVTMLISGLWHGAGATFIVWGFVHGVYLVINHAWRLWRPDWDKVRYERVMRPLGFAITFLSVVAAMVLFRAKTFAGAGRMLAGMAGFSGAGLPQAVLSRLGAPGHWLAVHGPTSDAAFGGGELVRATAWLLTLLFVVFALPNALELMGRFEPALNFNPSRRRRFDVRFTWGWAATFGFLLVVGAFSLNRVSEFLYWQF